MKAKIEVSNNGGKTVFASFNYHGSTGGRAISSVIRKKILGVTDKTLYRLVQRYGRICVWCNVEPEPKPEPERIEADDELGRLYYSDVLDAHGNRI